MLRSRGTVNSHALDLIEYAIKKGFAGGGGSSGVLGAVQFSNGAGGFASDDANFHFDNVLNRLGIGTNIPAQALHVVGGLLQTTGVFSLSGNATSTLTTTAGNLVLDSFAAIEIAGAIGSTATSVNIGNNVGSPTVVLHGVVQFDAAVTTGILFTTGNNVVTIIQESTSGVLEPPGLVIQGQPNTTPGGKGGQLSFASGSGALNEGNILFTTSLGNTRLFYDGNSDEFKTAVTIRGDNTTTDPLCFGLDIIDLDGAAGDVELTELQIGNFTLRFIGTPVAASNIVLEFPDVRGGWAKILDFTGSDLSAITSLTLRNGDIAPTFTFTTALTNPGQMYIVNFDGVSFNVGLLTTPA